VARVGRLDALTHADSARVPSSWASVDGALAVISAAIIAYGVLALGWPVFLVMAIFWFENVVIGGFNVLRMLVSGLRMGPSGFIAACAMAAFFTVHYGLFTAVHGVFVVMLFGVAEIGREALNGGLLGPLQRMLGQLVADRDGWLAIIAIVAVQVVAFARWWVETRERPTPLKELMGAPYGRIVILHVALIAGGFLVLSLHAPVLGVLLLIALKLAYDLIAPACQPRSQTEYAAQQEARRLLVIDRRTLR
jgi:Family of unknown function (DUF6498)